MDLPRDLELKASTVEYCRTVLSLLVETNRVYIGGDGSRYALELIGAVDGDDVDLVLSLLDAERDEIEPVAVYRKHDALNYLGFFVENSPDQPVLLRGENDAFRRVLTETPNRGELPLCANNFSRGMKILLPTAPVKSAESAQSSGGD